MINQLSTGQRPLFSLSFFVLLASLVTDINGRFDLRLDGLQQWPVAFARHKTIKCPPCFIAGGTRTASTSDSTNDVGDADDTLLQRLGYVQDESRLDGVESIFDVGNEMRRSSEIKSPTESGSNLVDKILMSFSYCSHLTVTECRQLHQHLERLVNSLIATRKLRIGDGRTTLISVRSNRQHRTKRATKQSDTTIEESSGPANNVEVDALEADKLGGAESRDLGMTTLTRRTFFDDDDNVGGYDREVRRSSGEPTAEEILKKYRLWRQEHGYGQQNGRWGRSVRSTKPLEKHPFQLKTAANSLASVADRLPSRRSSRQKRSLVVEIEWPEEDMSTEERDMLDAYLSWRERYGYGALSGRWG